MNLIKELDIRDLNHALVAALMAQQIERERLIESELATTSTSPTSTFSTNTTMLEEITEVDPESLDGKIISQIVTGSVFLLLEVLLILAYIILIKNNRIDYRQRMTYILILICNRKASFKTFTYF